MRGKVPKPTHLHVVEGTLNTTRHRKRKAEPKPVGELSSPPAWMNEGQRERWEYAIRHAPGGLLKKLGESTLTAWAVAAAAHRDLAQNIPRSRRNALPIMLGRKT
jgi:hypothetical protein